MSDICNELTFVKDESNLLFANDIVYRLSVGKKKVIPSRAKEKFSIKD
jgi:hypothetical protein